MAKKDTQRNPIYFEISTQKEMAELLGCSSKTITDYVNDGLMVKAPGRGRYFTKQSVLNVLNKLRDASRGQRNSTTSYQQERTKTEKIKREREQILLKKAKGEMLTLEEVQESWSDFARIVKTQILGFPTRLRTVIPHLTDHDGETLRTECREMLSVMAEEIEDTVIVGDPEAISSE